jgi:hypothetical protein
VKDQRAVFKNIGCITDPAKINMYEKRMTLLAKVGFVFHDKEISSWNRSKPRVKPSGGRM